MRDPTSQDPEPSAGPEPQPPTEPEFVPEPQPPTDPPRRTGRLLAGLFLVLLGVAWLLQALDVVDIPWDVILPGALILVGVVLVVNSRTGASQGGLIALGVVLSVLLLLGSAIDLPLRGGVGERSVELTTTAQAKEGSELAIGELTVDLTDLAPVADETTVVRARVGIGRLVVLVPSGASVRVEGRAGLGNVRVFGDEEGGIDVNLVVQPPGGGDPAFDLHASVGIGEVSVELG